jgi:predicted DNA-binding transcriptional regulator AlpA
MDRQFLTLDELSRILRVKRTWIYNQTRQTGPLAIPRIKVGKYLRFELKKVMDWLEKQNALSR